MSQDPASRIESLLKLAGERDQPSPAALARAREAAHASWQRALDSPAPDAAHRPRRGSIAAWLVGSAAAALFAVAWWWPASTPSEEVATVAAVDGNVRRSSAVTVAAGGRVYAAEVLQTARGRVALTLGDALSLRLDHDTRLRLDGPDHVTLLSGRLYVDSGGLSAHMRLRIDTPAGEVRHVGTQFQVRVSDDLTRVQVREGRVVLATAHGQADLAAGDVADAAGGRIRVLHGQPHHGADWEWVAATAPAFDIENRPLSEFLAWLAREHGWQLRFANAAVATRVESIRLHGSMAGLDARAMLERATLVTDVPLALEEGALWIGARQ